MQELSNALADALGQPGNPQNQDALRGMGNLVWSRLLTSAFNSARRSMGHWDLTSQARPPLTCLPSFSSPTFHSLLMKLIAAEIVAAWHGVKHFLIHELLALGSDEALIEAPTLRCRERRVLQRSRLAWLRRRSHL